MIAYTPNTKLFIISLMLLISALGFGHNLNPQNCNELDAPMIPTAENVESCVPVFIINELDADTAGTDLLEFVEIYDGGMGNSSLDGLVLVMYNGSSDTSYNAYDLDGQITNAQGYFVLGNAAVLNVSIVVPSNSIQNGADAVGLYTANALDFPNGTAVTTANLIDALVYDTNDSDDPGLLVLLNAGEAQINEDAGGNKDGHSNQRIPNGSGGARNTTTYSQDSPTPGTENGAIVVVTISLISEIQGSGLVSPLASTTVRAEAIVVGDFQNDDQLSGFFIQEEDTDADGDVATSEGVFVYCNSCPINVMVGDAVDVTGLAVDFFGMTQIDVTALGGDITVISSGNTLPSSASIALPAASSTEAEGTFESTEGMLITITTNLVVSEYFELARYGQLVLSANSRFKQFTDTNNPDPAGYSAFLNQLDKSRIILDDDNNIQSDAISNAPDDAYFWPRPGASNTNAIRGGDEISMLQGIMHWSYAGQNGTNAWRIRPVEEAFTYNFTTANPRIATPPDVGGAFKVGSFNVLNYFTTLDERGAHSIAELDRQRAKIAAAICELNADIVGLIEIENNGLMAINDLLNGTNGINSSCANNYAAVNAGTIGSDEIAVAFIYNTATVSPEGAFAILDSSVDPLFNDDKNRPVLAQTFMETNNGGKLTVAVNHLKSKGSPCDDVGDLDLNDGAGNCNETRTNAAIAIVNWLATDPTNSGDPDFMIIGDLNAYSKETPIDAIKLGADGVSGTSDDYVDLLEAYIGPSAYSYVFDGQLGYLDYALASQSLVNQLTGAAAWHINADEANIYDYNDGIQDPGEASFERKSNALPIYEANAYRASDHDPILVGINLGVPPIILCTNPILVTNDVGLCGAIVNFPDATAMDPAGGPVSVMQTGGLISGSLFPVGVSIVEFTATNTAGYISTCTFTITVEDNSSPVVSCPASQTIDLGANSSFYEVPDYFATGEATASDNCTDPVVIISQDPATGTLLGNGVYTITCSAEDAYGNIGTCTFELTIENALGVNDAGIDMSSIVLYPNPTTDHIILSNPNQVDLNQAIVYDMSGRRIQNIDLRNTGYEAVLDISALANATYMIVLESSSGQISRQIVKE